MLSTVAIVWYGEAFCEWSRVLCVGVGRSEVVGGGGVKFCWEGGGVSKVVCVCVEEMCVCGEREVCQHVSLQKGVSHVWVLEGESEPCVGVWRESEPCVGVWRERVSHVWVFGGRVSHVWVFGGRVSHVWVLEGESEPCVGVGGRE